MATNGKKIKYSILLYISCIFVIFAAYSTYSSLKAISAIENELTATVNETILQMRSNVENNLKQYSDIADNLAQDNDVLHFIDGKISKDNIYDAHQLQQKLISSAISTEYIDSICLYSEAADMILSTGAYTNTQQFNDTGWLDSYREQKYLFSVFYRYNKQPENTPVITIVRMLPAVSGTFSRGAIVLNIRQSMFSNVFKKTFAKDFMNIYITDKSDTVLYNSINRDYTMANILYKPGELTDMFGNTVINSNHEKYNLYYDQSGTHGLKYYIQMPLSRSATYKYNMIFSLVAILVLMLIFTVYYINKLETRNLDPIDKFVDSIVMHMKENNRKFPLDNSSGINLELLYNMLADNDKDMREQLIKSYPAIRWQMILGILTGEFKKYDEISNYLKLLDISFYPNNYIVMLTEIDQRLDIFTEMTDNMIGEYVNAIYNRADKISNETDAKSLSIKTSENKVVTIFSFETNDIDKNINTVSSCANILQNDIISAFDITISCGIGGFYFDISNVNNSYLEAEYALSNKFLIGNNAVISIEDIEFTQSGDIEDILSMIEALKNKSLYSMHDAIDEIFNEIVQRRVAQHIFKQFAVSIIINIFLNVDAPGIKDAIFERNEFKNIYYRISQFKSVKETKEYIDKLIETIINEADNQSETLKNNKLINDVIEYMDEHYMDPEFSLNMVGDVVDASPSHISRLFKKITGVNFIDFLTELRMKKAISLLKESEEKISDIGLKVGYINPNSFMRVFKKYTGMTPSECRNGKS